MHHTKPLSKWKKGRKKNKAHCNNVGWLLNKIRVNIVGGIWM